MMRKILFFSILLIIVVVSLVFLVKSKSTLDNRILPNTSWVTQEFTIYFLQDNRFGSINIDGSGLKYILTAERRLSSYHFSPDGKYIIICGIGYIYLLDRQSSQVMLVDEKKDRPIMTIKWAPDSQKFFYALADKQYVFDCIKKEKKLIEEPLPLEVFWDAESSNIYYNKSEPISKKRLGLPDLVIGSKDRIFRFSLSAWRLEFVTELELSTLRPERKKGIFCLLPDYNLTPWGIRLFVNKKWSDLCTPCSQGYDWISEGGMEIGLDKFNYLYYIDNAGRKKKLPLIIPESFKGGIVVDNVRWIPGNRYVIMEYFLEDNVILILEPSTGKIGKLMRGGAPGWYPN